jgi:hypothetical protein
MNIDCRFHESSESSESICSLLEHMQLARLEDHVLFSETAGRSLSLINDSLEVISTGCHWGSNLLIGGLECPYAYSRCLDSCGNRRRG